MTAPAESALQARPHLSAHRAFALYWCARTATAGAYQMQAVAIGWQIYELTGSALDLGLVGLVQFVPIVVLAPLIGQAADHFDRRALARTCQIVKAVVAAVLALATLNGWIGREAILGLLFITGTARAFETPTLHALLPALVPRLLLPRAIAAAATANQTAIICGPALGGLFYAFGATAVYAICTAVFVAASILVSLLPRPPRQPDERQKVSFATLFAGFAYIRRHPFLLGAISLDLFAVLLGGVTALLPIYARDILQTGPWGLGLLRSAPAVGALAISVVLARHGFERHIGAALFGSVALFGAAAVAFALSTSLALSLAALAVYGAADATSVVIRHSLVQTRTPNDMLGRVMAVNSMFTGTSGTLGEFRAGAVAAWLGVVYAVLIGGAGVLAVTLAWMWLFPVLRSIRSLQERETTT
jgi:MFS family permease